MSAGSDFDVLVVGGGPAGLSAALTLGRVRRRVLLAADGPARNATSRAAHNVFTRDGTPPAELLAVGRAQLAPYDVTIRDERVVDATQRDGRFVASFASGEQVGFRGIVLATGVRDILPALPGFEELWGTGVFHCPFCHGWEVAGRPLAVYGRDEAALHLARLVRGLTDDVIVLGDGPAAWPSDGRSSLEAKGVVFREESLERLVGERGRLSTVVLGNGESIERDGVFLAPKQEQRSDLHHRLRCPLSQDGRVEADASGRTPVPGVFVAGDAGPGMQTIPTAIATGARAGAVLHFDLLDAD